MTIDEYTIEEKIQYKDGACFFEKYLKKNNIITGIYYLCIGLDLVIVSINILKRLDFEYIMTNLGMAIFIFVPYMFIHELLHLAAYILLGGGKKIGVGMKKGIFYSTCSNYILSNKGYMFAALLPTIIVSAICAYLYIMFSNLRGYISMFCLIQLLASNIDIGIASYCKMNIRLSYYEDKNSEEMYFIRKKGE